MQKEPNMHFFFWPESRSTTTRAMSIETKGRGTPPKREVPPALRPLRWVGIPDSVLSWKPRVPSRNWCIFWTTLAVLGGLYYDDRRKCKLIMEEYKDRVRGLSEVKMNPLDLPRKVQVYTAKYPGDDNYDVGVTFFKRYVKPILVAGGVDFEILSGTSYGNLARELRNRIHERRRNLAGIEPWTTNTPAGTSLPTTLSPAQFLQRELDGAVVLIGRPAFKEWAWALKEGWGTSIPVKPVDYNEQLAAELSEDGAFEEEPTESSDAEAAANNALLNSAEDNGAAPLPAMTTPTRGFQLPTQVGMQSLQRGAPSSFMRAPSAPAAPQTPTGGSALPEPELPPMEPIPAQPPICFVDYKNLVGFRNIPRRIARFFYRREDVRRGAEAGLSIVLGTKNDAREFDPGAPGTIPSTPPQGRDLDWGVEEETVYPKRFFKTLEDIKVWREGYYKELRKELNASREIARGAREPTKAEQRDMPKSEIELRSQRFEKEQAWRNSEQGFEILNPEAGVVWDESWRGSLRVLRERPSDERVPRSVPSCAGTAPTKHITPEEAAKQAADTADGEPAPVVPPTAAL